MILLLPVLALRLALIAVGHRDLAVAWSPQAARGVLSVLVGVGAIIWLLNNITL